MVQRVVQTPEIGRFRVVPVGVVRAKAREVAGTLLDLGLSLARPGLSDADRSRLIEVGLQLLDPLLEAARLTNGGKPREEVVEDRVEAEAQAVLRAALESGAFRERLSATDAATAVVLREAIDAVEAQLRADGLI